MDAAAVWEYGAADRGAARGKRVEDSWKVRTIVNRVQGMAVREEVYAQAPGASTFLGQTGEQWRRRSSTTRSRGSLLGIFPDACGVGQFDDSACVFLAPDSTCLRPAEAKSFRKAPTCFLWICR
jgi:hypothetical protein